MLWDRDHKDAPPRKLSTVREEQLDLNAIIGPDITDMDPVKAKQMRASKIEQIRKLAEQMLNDAGEAGVGFDEVREAAERRAILTGAEEDRFLSFGAAMMKKLGGVPIRYRQSRNRQAQRRRVAVYVHKKFHPDAEVLGKS